MSAQLSSQGDTFLPYLAFERKLASGTGDDVSVERDVVVRCNGDWNQKVRGQAPDPVLEL